MRPSLPTRGGKAMPLPYRRPSSILNSSPLLNGQLFATLSLRTRLFITLSLQTRLFATPSFRTHLSRRPLTLDSSLRLKLRQREAHDEERNPLEDEVEQKDDNHQKDERADRDDRNRERAHHPKFDAAARPARLDLRHLRREVFVKRPRKHRQHEVAERDSLHALHLTAERVGDHEDRVLVELAQARRGRVNGERDAYGTR